MSLRRILAVLLLPAVLALGCVEFEGARINVYNGSGVRLTDVTLSGAGFEETIESLAPGGTTTLRVHPEREGGLTLTFTADGERHVVEEQGTFHGEAHFQVRVEVRAGLEVVVRTFMK